MKNIHDLVNILKNKKDKSKTEKNYIKAKKDILINGIHSELMIDRPDGKDRCSLILSSYDTPQLKELKESLKKRGIESDLLEDFKGGKTDFKFNLTPDRNVGRLNMEEDFDNFLSFLDRYFMYGKPVRDIGFFTKEEKEIMRKWYK